MATNLISASSAIRIPFLNDWNDGTMLSGSIVTLEAGEGELLAVVLADVAEGETGTLAIQCVVELQIWPAATAVPAAYSPIVWNSVEKKLVHIDDWASGDEVKGSGIVLSVDTTVEPNTARVYLNGTLGVRSTTP